MSSAIPLLFIRRPLGSLVSVIAGLAGLSVGVLVALLLGWSGHDPTVERLQAILPGIATVILGVTDLVASFAPRAFDGRRIRGSA